MLNTTSIVLVGEEDETAHAGHEHGKVGQGLALLLIGGALGKAACGRLGQHPGVVWSVIANEAATAADDSAPDTPARADARGPSAAT